MPESAAEEKTGPARILVIKHGALGDFVLAMGPFKAIRRHHGDAHVTLLTTAPYAGLGGTCGYFDEVWVDSRPRFWNARAWLSLAMKLRRRRFDRVYDLQTSDRTALYYRLLAGRRPEWSGVVRGCSHPHANPRRNAMHTVERQAEQLSVAGIADTPSMDLSWAKADVGRFALSGCYALLVPGGSAHRPEKRWPRTRFTALARHLAAEGLRPVLIGAAAERETLERIASNCGEALNLAGRTNFEEIVELARSAAIAVGNDTGPMHLIAAAGCPCVVLFSQASDPARTVPRGPSVEVLRRSSLADLPLDTVIETIRPR
jgi:ADP-heptose:LPS heptosyltransferase